MYSPNRPEYIPEQHEPEPTQPISLPINWDQLPHHEKLQYLTTLSLTKKAEILSIQTPTDNSDSALRARRLLNDAADAIIHTTLRVNEIQFHSQSLSLLQELTNQIKAYSQD